MLIRFFFIFFGFFLLKAQNTPAFLDIKSKIIDSLIKKAPIEDLIGQVLMPAVYPKKTDPALVFEWIEKYKIGGLMWMQTPPKLYIQQYNTYQKVSKIPLLMSMDAEWGLAMRMDSVLAYPKAMALGAMKDPLLVEEMAVLMGKQLKKMGIHVNFAPVVDVNNNPQNPVINYRSFGESPTQVIQNAMAYADGLLKENISPCIKHFPGHGDVNVDSHLGVPILLKSKEELEFLEWLPFRKMIDAGTPCVMVGHLKFPFIDSVFTASLSPFLIKKNLIDELEFKGLIFSDALNMGAVQSFFPDKAQLALAALEAGNEILVYPEDIPGTYQLILDKIKKGKINEKEFRKKVKKILQYKMHFGVFETNVLDTLDIMKFSLEQEGLVRKMIERSFTLLKNQDQILPLNPLKINYLEVVVLGAKSIIFEQNLQKFYPNAHFIYLPSSIKNNEIQALLSKIPTGATVLLSINNMITSPAKAYGLDAVRLDLIIQNLTKKNASIVLNFLGNPYALDTITQIDALAAILVGYENNTIVQELSIQALFGAAPVQGKLPVATQHFDLGTGLRFTTNRLGWGMPEQMGMSSEVLEKIDSVVQQAIATKAFPGCKVLVARGGKIIFDRNYGYHTYAKQNPVTDSSVYDLASVTKILGATLAIMNLESEGKINIDQNLSYYFPQLADSEYGQIKIESILSHQAGFIAWIPFYLKTLEEQKKNKKDKPFYKAKPNRDFSVKVAESVYLRKDYLDSIFARIVDTPLKNKEQYVYSDLGFYFLAWLVEKITKQSFDFFLKTIYQDLGLFKIGFNPLNWVSKEKIPPTEIDNYFRHQVVQGHVHDQGAAMLGGVAGHAGLFSDAYSAAALMQLFLNKGTYAQKKIFEVDLMQKYNKNYSSSNHRGLGFDKLREGKDHVASSKASWQSFGHTGFTGTIIWADPAYDLIFVFLSNRTYPSSENKLISKLNVRTEIHNLIYQAILF